jgi:hypothetical protein
MAEAIYDARDAVKELTLDVKITHGKAVAFRIRCGILLIKLASFVMGLGVHVESEIR